MLGRHSVSYMIKVFSVAKFDMRDDLDAVWLTIIYIYKSRNGKWPGSLAVGIGCSLSASLVGQWSFFLS